MSDQLETLPEESPRVDFVDWGDAVYLHGETEEQWIEAPSDLALDLSDLR